MMIKNLLVCLIVAYPLSVMATTIDVFLPANMHYQGQIGTHIHVHYVNQQKVIEQDITNKIRQVSGKAKQKQLAKELALAQKQAIISAYKSMFSALEMGVTKVPAIVFDHKYVVYGMHDVVKAQAIFDAYMDGHANEDK